MDEDLVYQLTTQALGQMTLKHELATYCEVVQLTAFDKQEKIALDRFYNLTAEIESLNNYPESQDDKDEIFQYKRNIIKTLVNRVAIDKRKNLRVEIRFDMRGLLKKATPLNISEVEMAGIYSNSGKCRRRT